jgi:uncharacterized membrane protein YqiK
MSNRNEHRNFDAKELSPGAYDSLLDRTMNEVLFTTYVKNKEKELEAKELERVSRQENEKHLLSTRLEQQRLEDEKKAKARAEQEQARLEAIIQPDLEKAYRQFVVAHPTMNNVDLIWSQVSKHVKTDLIEAVKQKESDSRMEAFRKKSNFTL